MKFEYLIARLQTIFGLTKTELIIAGLLLSGLVIGAGVKYFANVDGNDKNRIELIKELTLAVDSLSRVHQTTFIGTDINDSAYQELKVSDTVVAPKSQYPQRGKKSLPEGKININTASKVELMKLPGIGEAMADRIIDYRKGKKFMRVEDIKNVKGIGEKKFLKLKEYIEVK